jgi:CotH kinase protein/Lamin Tail Domain/Secretion system C-terminal sorting domain
MNRFTPFCILGFLLILCGRPEAQVTLTDSNLPIVIITIDGGGGIPDEPKVKGTMKILYAGEGQRNVVANQNDPTKLNYNGRIGIELRGSSSQFLEKKQYALTTLQADNVSNNNVSLLGMPAENDWILSGLAFDASFMRDFLAFTLSRRIGQYAPRTQFCELILNGNYRGIYMLVEKIKVDDGRVDVTKIEPTDNTLPDLSGGYITKADKIAGVDVAAWNMAGNWDGTNFVHEFPKPNEITSAQNTYIQSVFSSLASRASISSITSGFPSVIDVPSFLDFMLINELGSNADAYQFSTYFHKDKNAKLRAGPIWDSNLTYGYDLVHWGLNRSFPNVWQFNNGDNIGPQFWRDLFNNTIFKCYLAKRWNALTQPGQPLNQASLYTLVDETATLLTEASVREHTRWDAQIYIPLYSNQGLNPTLTGQVSMIKNFIAQRITWMTTNLGSFGACSNVITPPLVITRINYQPETSATFPQSSDQEFIEIANPSSDVVDATGFYFSGTGFVYQFPNNFQFPPNSVVQIANKRSTFSERYGYPPFGQFTRNLSNTGQKLTLAGAYGNVIDEVEYSNLAPWPTVNGNGSHLKLSSVELDNTVGTNWVASSDLISSTVVGLEESASAVKIFPNPVNDLFKVEADDIISVLAIQDAQGRVVETFKPNAATATLNLNTYPNGLYTIRLQIKNQFVIKKLLKR